MGNRRTAKEDMEGAPVDLAEQISYEIALHSEDTYRQLCKLSGVLKAAGKEEGFAVSVE